MIGDPTREVGNQKKINQRRRYPKCFETYKEQVFKILDPEKTKIVFNSHWCSKMNFEDVLILSSKCNVARLLEKMTLVSGIKRVTPFR